MSSQEYENAYAEIKRQNAAAVLALDIKKWGPCPGYKNHFDLKSFVIGALFAVVFCLIVVSVIK